MKLFHLITPSTIYVDILSGSDNTYYRVYLYLIYIEDLVRLSSQYEENKNEIVTKFIGIFDDSYRETDKIGLFNVQSFINKVNTYNPQIYDTSNGIFQNSDGTSVNVRGRTMKVIATLNMEGKIIDVITNKKVTNIVFNPKSTTNLFNTYKLL